MWILTTTKLKTLVFFFNRFFAQTVHIEFPCRTSIWLGNARTVKVKCALLCKQDREWFQLRLHNVMKIIHWVDRGFFPYKYSLRSFWTKGIRISPVKNARHRQKCSFLEIWNMNWEFVSRYLCQAFEVVQRKTGRYTPSSEFALLQASNKVRETFKLYMLIMRLQSYSLRVTSKIASEINLSNYTQELRKIMNINFKSIVRFPAWGTVF